ncbi:MAG: class I SAM-dependent methyltransferase [Candidatus Omnitrophota bacterium]|nr:class I SAM-dependent methyltransferase [Candidatus Omnitrophota bacterium]
MQTAKDLYKLRFNENEKKRKNALWQVLCRDFLQGFINPESSVLDLGAGFCEFINNIKAKNKYAVDINPQLKNYAGESVQVINAHCANLQEISTESIDVVFSSEFFEHLKNKEELFATLKEVHRILRERGKLIVVCPNIRYVGHRYWDFIDHGLPLTHLGMREALLMHHYSVVKLVPRFLPYTTKSRFPKSQYLLRIYLKLPILWRIFGTQMFIVAEKKRAE